MRFSVVVDRPLYVRVMKHELAALRRLGAIWIVVCIIAILGRAPSVGILALLLAGILFVVSPWLAMRRAFATSKLLDTRYNGDADDDGLTVNSITGTNRIPWPMFYRAAVTPTLALLYLSGKSAYVFTPAFFQSEGEWDSFKTLIASKVLPKKSGVLGVFIQWLAIIIVVVLAWSLVNAR